MSGSNQTGLQEPVHFLGPHAPAGGQPDPGNGANNAEGLVPMQAIALGMARPSLNWDEAADVIASTGWSGTPDRTVTYAYRSDDAESGGFERFDANLITQTDTAFALWADVANIVFERRGEGTEGEAAYSNAATIRLAGDTETDSYAFAYLPFSRAFSSLAGDVTLNTSNGQFDDVSEGSYEFLTVMHEIGHSIGLLHPGSYNGGSPTYENDADYIEDSQQFTVMSYFSASETGADHGAFYAATPLLHDIAAVQFLYGANYETRSGDTVYGFNSNADRESFVINDADDAVVFAIWDGGGIDTLDFSGYRDDQRIDLAEEAFSDVGGLTGNVSIARGVTVENAATGAGDDALFGNDADNGLNAGSGKDTIEGGGGQDAIRGGSSNDTLHGGDGNDTISGGKHKDWLYGDAGDDVLNGNSGDDYIYGGAGDDLLQGTSGRDRLFGGDGDDRLEGGSDDDKFFGGAGDDTFVGGGGHDTADYMEGATSGLTADLVAGTVEAYGPVVGGDVIGHDTLSSVEAVKATAFDDVLRGDDGDNAFWGLSGDDHFHGGAGADWMKGGRGTDTFTWDADDIARDGVHQGVDELVDFSINQDVMDLSAVADDLGALQIEMEETDAGTLVSIRLETGESHAVAVMRDKFDLDAQDMIDDGNILI